MRDEDFSDGIYWILHAVNYDLGGGYDISTGIDYKNDVFETFSFWSHCDCTCTYEAREVEWEGANPHTRDCYQSAIRDLGFGYSWETGNAHQEQNQVNEKAVAQACAIFGIDPGAPGSYTHCTCGRDARRTEWLESARHDQDCRMREYGFRHFASGLEVSWYKRVGRSTSSNRSLKTLEWFEIVTECLKSIRDKDYRDVFKSEPEEWRNPLGALRLTLTGDADKVDVVRAQHEVEELVKVLNGVK